MFFQAGEDILDANTFAYCGNNPINCSDANGECKKHNGYYIPLCNPELLRYQRQHISWLNRVYERNDIVAVNDEGEFIYRNSAHRSITLSSAGDGLSYIRGTIYNLAETGAVTVPSATGIAAIGTVITTPLSIASYATNPYLTNSQKRSFIVIDCFAAAGSITLAYAIANFWNPTGWAVAVAFGITMAYTVGTTVAISCFTNACANDNKERWSS